MINFDVSDKRISSHDIDSDTSLLIIGKGNSEFKENEVIKCKTIDEVEYLYGQESQLTNAFKEAYEIGARDIYLCNCYKYTDYITILDLIANQEFAYITPLFDFSETFISEDGKNIYLAELYSNILADRLTQIILTDKHASLYEDLQHYVNSMNKINYDFKDSTFEKLPYGANLCFVLNILKDYKFANVALASILVQNDFKNYPQKNVGDVVFDLNNIDVFGQELIYFAYDDLAKTTIENFLNYNPVLEPEKYVPNNIIKQRILRGLDFSEMAGSLYSPYKKIIIQNKANQIMSSFVGRIIESYKVKRIEAVRLNDEPNTIRIIIYTTFKPYVSIEELDAILEV